MVRYRLTTAPIIDKYVYLSRYFILREIDLWKRRAKD